MLFLLAFLSLSAWICWIAGFIPIKSPALGVRAALLVAATLLAARIGRPSASSSPKRKTAKGLKRG